jgi:hypothetical protein
MGGWRAFTARTNLMTDDAEIVTHHMKRQLELRHQKPNLLRGKIVDFPALSSLTNRV